MDKINSFEQLEEVVNRLLVKMDDLKILNKSLEKSILDKDDKIDELEATVSSLTDDQENINGRVSSLLSSIEEWEKAETTGSDSAVALDVTKVDNSEVNKQDDVEVKPEANLFSMGN